MSEPSKGRPILRLVISAVNSADDPELQAALSRMIAGQNSSIHINAQPQEGYYSLEGRTEADLDSICDRLRDEFHLPIHVGPPTAILLETVRKQAEAEGKYIRQTGGSGNYGHCKIRIEPDEPGKGYEFINDIKGGSIPSEYIESIDQGIQAAMRQGVLAGFPVVDVRVTLYDGSYHETDSNPMAFTFAGSLAFKEAAKNARPVLLEPVMAIEIDVPDAFTPIVEPDIFQRRGRIDRMVSENGRSEIKAIVPLAELLTSGFSSLTEFPTEFAGYEAVSDDGASDENGPGVTANKPNHPPAGRRSEMARPEPEEE